MKNINRRHIIIGVVSMIGLVLLWHLLWPRFISTDNSPDSLMSQWGNLRTMATAIELYKVDNGAYPNQVSSLRAPVNYLRQRRYDRIKKTGIWYRLSPDNTSWTLLAPAASGTFDSILISDDNEISYLVYDPSNGTNSKGDLIVTNKTWSNKDLGIDLLQ